ncbi:sigma-54-dependent Fis family transcriptional regulator [Pseudomaricurvus sp. HS19]|uniref:sigma-54 interaction domain-containing protein n=1 Tax=Pseudomaricurvus sp. HS19 TaxID=2692626 RepID=UPI001F2C6B16|nr:sigma-54 dependent transcriptional regulator [Pseudomaricurvus sp. HS19]
MSTLLAESFERVELLIDERSLPAAPYVKWLSEQSGLPVTYTPVQLSSPVHYGDIYRAAKSQLGRMDERGDEIHVLLSPGTPVMHAVWVLLCKTQFPQATLWQSSKEAGVEQVHIPFHISAEYRPAADQISSKGLWDLSLSRAPADAAFDDIVTQTPVMQRLISQASLLATKAVPVLIYGESGTGKELFARAIHNASSRSASPFVALNCGAIPSELVDSVLFGHKKGAFTGAHQDRQGVFKKADGGTLFLDEFGELEPSVQVRLLRALQEGVITPVGAADEQAVDVRIICATNKDLMAEVAEGRFREDLFYRVAVGVLHLPPLRQREGDLTLLMDAVLDSLQKDDTSLEGKKFSVEARNIILSRPWVGNMRELHSTIFRAAIWSEGENISAEDIRSALIAMPEQSATDTPIDWSQGIDLQEICDDLRRKYIRQALVFAKGKKTRAAELLGFGNYQTLSNQMEKLGITSDDQ